MQMNKTNELLSAVNGVALVKQKKKKNSKTCY